MSTCRPSSLSAAAPCGADAVLRPEARRTRRRPGRQLPAGALRSVLGAAALLLTAGASQAFDLGPFSLTGFVKASAGYVSNGCEDCQRDPAAGQQTRWSQATKKPYGVYGITLPRLGSADTKPVPDDTFSKTIQVLSSAAFAYFRDSKSLALAKESGT